MSESPAPRSRFRSLGWVVLAYLVALAAAVVAGAAVQPAHPLWVVAAADLAATLVIFAASRLADNSSVYDPYWSVVPPLIALYLVWIGEAPSGQLPLRQALVLLLVWAWGARLTYNWVRGWPGLHHEDWRYVAFRRGTGRAYWLVSLTGIHLFPTVMVYLGCLPLLSALDPAAAPLGWLDGVALLVTGGAVLLEATADRQLHRFVRRRTDPGQFMASGLWAWCRHPNYLGEILFWWGLFLFGLAAVPGRIWPMAGALAMTVMFVAVSVPMIDRRMVQRKPGYAEQMKRVPALLPRPPKK